MGNPASRDSAARTPANVEPRTPQTPLTLLSCLDGTQLAELVKPENKAKLTAILTLHVMPDKVMVADVKSKKMLPESVNGEAFHVDGTNGETVNRSKVT